MPSWAFCGPNSADVLYCEERQASTPGPKNIISDKGKQGFFADITLNGVLLLETAKVVIHLCS